MAWPGGVPLGEKVVGRFAVEKGKGLRLKKMPD